jgi:hypothetical protein
MKCALVFLALLFATGVVVPQDAPQDPRFTTKIETVANGGKMFSITNRSQIPITAIVIFAAGKSSNGNSSRSNMYFDSVSGAVGAFTSAILPQETRAVMVGGPPRATDTLIATYTLKAVVFEDGTSVGDAESVGRILHAREFLWRNVSAVVSTLEAAKVKPVNKDVLLQQLDENQKAEKAERLKEMTSGVTNISLIASSAFANAKANIEVPDNALIPAAKINQFADSYLNIRQRLINSKPQIPGTENMVAANSAVPADFEIRLGPGVKSEDVSVFYEIRPAPGSEGNGTAGGVGAQSVQHAFRIPALIDGKPAHRLRAFIFGKGCAAKVIDIPDLAASSRSAEYDCVQLPLINFTGRVEPSEFMAGKKYRVRIEVFNLTIARADLDSDGIFHAQITDYSSDPVCIPEGQCFGAALTFYADVIGVNPGDAKLEPIGSAAIQGGGLRPMTDYGGEVVFRAIAF